MSEAVLYEMKGQVAVITINQPDRRNALGIAVRQGLWDAWDRFEKDDDAKVAIPALVRATTDAGCPSAPKS